MLLATTCIGCDEYFLGEGTIVDDGDNLDADREGGADDGGHHLRDEARAPRPEQAEKADGDRDRERRRDETDRERDAVSRRSSAGRRKRSARR